MDLFTLVARLGMDSTEYEKGIVKARGSFSELGRFAGAKAVAFGTLAAHAIEKAAGAAVNLGKSAVQAAAEIEAEQAMFRSTFGTMQGEAEKAFKAVEKSTNIVSGRLQNVGTKAFAQFKGAGLDATDALSMMEEYTTLAADAAAYFNISLEDADQRLRSFLRGNTEAGDAIQLFTSESQRNTAAMEKYGKTWTKLTEAQKQMLMLDVSKEIYNQIGVIGQAGREGESLENVLGNIKRTWDETLQLFGSPIKAVVTPIIENVDEWLQREDVQLKITQFGLTAANAINWVLHPTFPTWEEIEGGSEKAILAIQNGLNTAINWTLGKLGMPDLQTIQSDVKNWWTGQGDNAYERIKSVLGWTLGEFAAPNAESVAETMDEWWRKTGRPSIQSVVDWTLGELYLPAWIDLVSSVRDWWINRINPAITTLATIDIRNVKFPSLPDMVAAASSWWSGIKSTISEIFTISVKMHQGDTSYTPSTPAGIVDAITSATGRIPGFATGLDYVPQNNFLARLHEGEAVLTKSEATMWRQDIGIGSGNAALLEEIRGLRRDLATRREVFAPDGRVIGDLVTETVSRNIASRAQSRRYQPI